MGAVFEVIFDGIKKFAGEIVGVVLLVFALRYIPGVRSLFKRAKKLSEEDMEAENQRRLELHRQEEERLTSELAYHEEALKKAEAQKTEQARLRADTERQLEAQRKEEERIKAEVQQQKEALVKAEAQKTEQARLRADTERQLEADQHESGEIIIKGLVFTALLLILVVIASWLISINSTQPIDEQTQAEAQEANESGKKFYAAENYEQAAYYYRKAADLGLADAQLSLGYMYYNGYGVPQNYGEAAKWYRKAAEQGLAGAQFNLGYMYHNGYGVQRNYSEAMKWYRKASEQGYAYADRQIKEITRR